MLYTPVALGAKQSKTKINDAWLNLSEVLGTKQVTNHSRYQAIYISSACIKTVLHFYVIIKRIFRALKSKILQNVVLILTCSNGSSKNTFVDKSGHSKEKNKCYSYDCFLFKDAGLCHENSDFFFALMQFFIKFFLFI